MLLSRVGKSAAGLAVLVFLGACSAPGIGGTSPSPSPHPSVTPSTAPPPSPTAAATAVPTATPGGTTSSVASCTGAIPSGDNLVLATLAGSATVVLRDISNLASPRTICTFAGSLSPHFATASVVGYTQQGADLGAPGKIVRLDLASGTATDVASWARGGFGSGLFDWSPDGRSLTYIAGSATATAWHLVAGGRDQVLASLPPVPGRGVSQDDDFAVAFSPDGLYLAMVQTFATGGTGDSAPVQVRRTSDGGLVYSATSGTWGAWASVPSRLFFRDAVGVVSRWDPGSGVSVMQSSLKWTHPHASPDGRWIAYTIYDGSGHPHVALYSVQGNSLGPAPIGLRSNAQFLNNTLVWYQEEAACDCGLTQSQPTGHTFIYDIGASGESVSRITGLFDAWPRVTSPPGLS
ncbi:MAG TPA: hypothetical protein VIN01_03965 [Candidatus Dormibacteraeota bacterium]